MECIEARALKSSFLSQMGMKTNYPHHMFCNDDVWCINSVPSDDFPVEELLNLDFSEKEFQEGLISLSREEEEQVPNKESSVHSSSSTFSGADEIDSLSELAVPVDDLENLEWLSQFVDDSSAGLSLPHPAESFKPGPNSGKRVDPVSRGPFFPVPIPVKARTTRSRKPSGRPWTLPSPVPLASGDSSSTPSSSHGSSTLTPFVFVKTVNDAEWFSSIEKPVAKKHKRKAEPETGSGRRCTHCQVQKTPQWRTGPSGPKTLCNACGVRYKSGRLFPEYRPAFSPTFSQELHSNSHRKVLEMRRRKETGVAVETVQMVEVGLTRLVQSS